MRIEGGFYIQMVDRSIGRVIYQCATDKLTDEEWDALWKMAGKGILGHLNSHKSGADLYLEIRASKIA